MRHTPRSRVGGVGNLIGRSAAPVQTAACMTFGDGRAARGRNVGRDRTMQRFRLIYYSLLVFTAALMVSAIANA